MSDIRNIAAACGNNDVDLPSYQFGNYSQGGVSGMIYHNENLKLYLAAQNSFDELCEQVYEDTKQYPKTIDDKVWMVIDTHWEEILSEMFDMGYVEKCEDCDKYLSTGDYCGECGKKPAEEEKDEQ